MTFIDTIGCMAMPIIDTIGCVAMTIIVKQYSLTIDRLFVASQTFTEYDGHLQSQDNQDATSYYQWPIHLCGHCSGFLRYYHIAQHVIEPDILVGMIFNEDIVLVGKIIIIF